jgi:hypothetical protein
MSCAVTSTRRREIAVPTTVTVASGNRIAFRDFAVTGGALPGAGDAPLDRVFERPIQLRNIPDGFSCARHDHGRRSHRPFLVPAPECAALDSPERFNPMSGDTDVGLLITC